MMRNPAIAFALVLLVVVIFFSTRGQRFIVPAANLLPVESVQRSPARVGNVRGGDVKFSSMTESILRRRDFSDDELGQLEADLRNAIAMTDVEERRVTLAALCVRWAKTDPIDALALARELRLEDMSGAVQVDIIQQWAMKDLAAAYACVEKEPAGEQRENLLARVAFVWSQSQPSVAARLVTEQIAPGPAQAEAGISVLRQWALRDFAAARAWAERFPADIRERAFEELNSISRQRFAQYEARN